MKKVLSITIICLVIFSTFAMLLPKVKASALVPHAPISIHSDSDFTPANGVADGSGTAEDPYIIEGWDIYASTHAILLDNTRAHFIIRNCYMHGGGTLYDGVWMRNVTNGVIERITSTGNAGGISASYAPSSNILIRNNVLSNNYCGILISGNSHNIEVVGNEISYNAYHGGIRFGWHAPASLNTIRGNNIHDNDRGIYVGLGSSDNFIYHNNFVDNTVQVYISMPATNVWDDGYPSGGNYWSDYEERYPNASEIDDSGIWDTPYVIDENNVDRYPFVNESGWETPTPEQAIRDLIDIVESMNLQQGIDNSLDAKLTSALDALEALKADQRNDAINKLHAFINEVEAQREKKLTNEQADHLIAATQEIIDLI